jgi:phenylalanine-4-hydroxylase
MSAKTVTTIENESGTFQHQATSENPPEFRDMQFAEINQLALDHPGANDLKYRTRRDYIASLSKRFREDPEHKIIDVEYTPEEQQVWQIVATKLEEIQAKRASAFYLEAKKKLGISTQRIPQLSEMNRRLGELTGFRLAPIEGLVETRGFLSWLAYRTMLCTQYIRHTSRPEYTPEPDIVHEAIGHIPNFTNPDFADFSQFIGHGRKDRNRRTARRTRTTLLVHCRIRFGRRTGRIKAYGAGFFQLRRTRKCFHR